MNIGRAGEAEMEMHNVRLLGVRPNFRQNCRKNVLDREQETLKERVLKDLIMARSKIGRHMKREKKKKDIYIYIERER